MILTLASNLDLMRLSSKTACCERQMSCHKSGASGSFSSLPRAPRDPGQALLA